MANAHLLRRGQTWFVRYLIPECRWADLGGAMGSRGGLRREIVRTLETRDYREAQKRRDGALIAIRTEVDQALLKARLKPLTDWTAAWETKALEHRAVIHAHGAEVITQGPDEEGDVQALDIMRDQIEAEAEVVERRQGPAASRHFLAIALGDKMTVAQGVRQWLAEQSGQVRNGTLQSHRGAFRKLGVYLSAHHGLPSLEVVPMGSVTRRIAGEALHAQRETAAAETVQRDFSAYSGLWRWAVRRQYASENPWEDQTAGLKSPRKHDAGREEPRGFSNEQLVRLILAGPDDLAPARGGYAATFWDLIRLCLLTGARPSELLGLEVQDVIEGGFALALGRLASKTDNSRRIVPLHPFAAAVVRLRLEAVPSQDPTAPLWPEVPPTGVDQRRSKIISNRFVAVRRRILGDTKGVDLYSFRRSFMTAAETAMHRGGGFNVELLKLLVGHKREALAFDLYSDWTRLGRTAMRGALVEKLRVLQAAVEAVVEQGFDSAIKAALEETAGSRPEMKRLTPAFRRS